MNGAGRADIKEDIKEEVGSKEPIERRSLIWPPKESQGGLERATGRAHKSAHKIGNLGSSGFKGAPKVIKRAVKRAQKKD